MTVAGPQNERTASYLQTLRGSPFVRLSIETRGFHARLRARIFDGRNLALILLQSFLCIGSVDRVRRSSTIRAEVFSSRRIPSDDKMFHSLRKKGTVPKKGRFRMSGIKNKGGTVPDELVDAG